MKCFLKSLNKCGVLVILCFLAVPGFLASQSTAMEIETLLNTSEVTYAQAARFVLEAAEVTTTSNPEYAFSFAVQHNFLPGNVAASDPARLDKLSLLLMRSFEIKGGIFYRIIGSPHYAYRELVYNGVIQGRHDPHMLVSGERLLFYVNRIFGLREESLADQLRRERMLAAALIRREALAATIIEIIEELEMTDTTVEVTDEGVTITLSNINFLPDSWELPEAEKAKIYEIAGILSRIPNVGLLVAGHTTRLGEREYLLVLSTNRAQSVADYLITLGAVEKANVSIIGYGADRLLIEGTSPEALAANRRVEIIILEF